MNESILKSKNVEELCSHISDEKLRKFIKLLPKYKINTLYDLSTASLENSIHIRGFGLRKWDQLETVKDILKHKLDQILDETNQMIDNLISDIPTDILEIPLEWLLDSNTVDVDYTSIILNTLEGKTIKDILILDSNNISRLRGVGKTKIQKIIDLQQVIKDIVYDKDRVENLKASYINSQTTPFLPSKGNENESYATTIKRFINEVIKFYEDRNKQELSDAISLYYNHGYDIKSIAINKNKTPEHFRQILLYPDSKHKSFIWQLRNLMSDGSENMLFEITNEFRLILQKIESFCKKTPLVSSLECLLGNEANKNIIKFVTDFVCAKIWGGEALRIKEEFIIADCELKHLNKVWGDIFKLMDDNVKPLNKESLIIFLRKKFNTLAKQDDLAKCIEKTIINIIENSNQFEVEKDRLVTTYSLKWHELTSLQSRVERILYENKQPMPKNEIETMYNRRLRECGLTTPDVFLIRASKNIHQLHEGGTWIWKEYTNENTTISRSNLIQQYIAKFQKFRLEEIMEYLKEIIPNINERTVKTLLNTYCVSTIEGYYIDKQCNEDFSNLHKYSFDDILLELTKIMEKGKEYTYQELKNLYSKKYNIAVPKSKISRTCENSNVFIISKGEYETSPNKVMINPEWDGSYKIKDRKRGVQVAWKHNVIEEAINKLRYAQNHEIECKELVSHLVSFIPKEIKFNNIYKIFKEIDVFIIKKNDKRRNIIALNEQVYSQKYLSENNDSTSVFEYQETNVELQKIQKQQSANPLYNISTNTDVDLSNLCSSTKALISWNMRKLKEDNMNIDDFEAVWSYMIEQMNIHNGNNDNAYYRMLNQLYNYMFGSTTRCNRYYLWVEVRLNYEPYLKKLLSSKGYQVDRLQLKNLIDLCQRNNLLPERNDCLYISNCISEILKQRNFKGHNAEDTPGDTIIIKNIQTAITLYLYTTMKFLKN